MERDSLNRISIISRGVTVKLGYLRISFVHKYEFVFCTWLCLGVIATQAEDEAALANMLYASSTGHWGRWDAQSDLDRLA